MAHSCNFITWKVEAGGSRVQGCPWLQCNFSVSWDTHRRHWCKIKKKQKSYKKGKSTEKSPVFSTPLTQGHRSDFTEGKDGIEGGVRQMHTGSWKALWECTRIRWTPSWVTVSPFTVTSCHPSNTLETADRAQPERQGKGTPPLQTLGSASRQIPTQLLFTLNLAPVSTHNSSCSQVRHTWEATN